MRRTATSVGLVLLLVSAGLAQGWQAVPSPTDETITGICAAHPDTMFVVTSKGNFARTTDGCRSWQSFVVSDEVHLEGVSFADSRIGVACGRNGSLFRTSDGGESWQACSPTDTVPWFSNVEMLDSRVGVVIGLSRDSASPFGGLCYRTIDSGRTWKEQESLGLGYAELLYLPNGPLYLLSFGRLHRSDDKGK
ncbi:MAG: YCF48-related protein, partial [Candidatus Zixiibacteriota bacterium]